MERKIIYNKNNTTHLFQYWKLEEKGKRKFEHPKTQEEALENFVYKTNDAQIRIHKTANDLRYAGWGIQAIWDLSVCFPWGWIHKTLRRVDDEDLTKVQAYVNKQLKKYKFNLIDIQRDAVEDNIGDIYVRNIKPKEKK